MYVLCVPCVAALRINVDMSNKICFFVKYSSVVLHLLIHVEVDIWMALVGPSFASYLIGHIAFHDPDKSFAHFANMRHHIVHVRYFIHSMRGKTTWLLLLCM